MGHIPQTKNVCSIMNMLWQELLGCNCKLIDVLMTNKIPHKTQLRKYFYEAFYPFYKGETPNDCSSNVDALALWAAYLKDYPYRSLMHEERKLYNTFYTIVANNAPAIANRWMTPEQLEEEYGFSQSWQNKARMVSSGSTLPFHKVGKFIKYDRQEIDQWIENHKVR